MNKEKEKSIFEKLEEFVEEKYAKVVDDLIFKREYDEGQLRLLRELRGILNDDGWRTPFDNLKKKRLVITIISSLSKRDHILALENSLMTMFPGAIIHTPLEDRKDILIDNRLRFVRFIEESDFVVVIPNKETVDGEENPSMSFGYTFGESCSYEIATAMSNFIPIFVVPTFQVEEKEKEEEGSDAEPRMRYLW